MGLWIAENEHTRACHVRGTALLDDLHAKEQPAADAAATNLKRDKNGIVLVPQPSDDPRDPLNWPRWKKEAVYLNILFCTGLVGAIGPIIAPGFVTIAAELDVTIDAVAETNAAMVLALGVVMFFQAALSTKYGRRPVYLAGTLLLLVGCIWSAAKPDIANLLPSRIIQGMGMAPTESIATATIGDLYFVKGRALRVAVWGLCLLGGINLAPLVNGYVIDSLGWQYCFIIIAPFFALSLITMIFFMPETAYDRHATVKTSLNDELAEKQSISHEENVGTLMTTEFLPPKTFWQEVKPWSGYKRDESIVKIFLRPFPLLLSPIVFWCFLTYGLATFLLIMVSAMSSLVFRTSYGFSASQTGLVSLSPLIASILMSLVAGYISDYLATFMARRNRGVFEPEHRLINMAVYGIMVICGYVGWAVAEQQGAHWAVPVVCYGLINGGQKSAGAAHFLSVASVTLVIDAHREQTAEAQAMINFLKNLISYFCGARINGWVQITGVSTMMFILAGCSAFFALTTIPMYRYGKIARCFVQRNEKLFLI